MATRKPKKTAQPGPIEQALKTQEQTAKVAQRKTSKALEPIALPIELEPFFAQQTKHKYGTCWQCGTARQSAGGLPGGFDAYWCDRCKCYLTIRHDRKDPAKIIIKSDKIK